MKLQLVLLAVLVAQAFTAPTGEKQPPKPTVKDDEDGKEVKQVSEKEAEDEQHRERMTMLLKRDVSDDTPAPDSASTPEGVATTDGGPTPPVDPSFTSSVTMGLRDLEGASSPFPDPTVDYTAGSDSPVTGGETGGPVPTGFPTGFPSSVAVDVDVRSAEGSSTFEPPTVPDNTEVPNFPTGGFSTVVVDDVTGNTGDYQSSTMNYGAGSTQGYGDATTYNYGASSTMGHMDSTTYNYGASSTMGHGDSSTYNYGASSTQGYGESSTFNYDSSSTHGYGDSSTFNYGSSSQGYGDSSTFNYGTSTQGYGDSTTFNYGDSTSFSHDGNTPDHPTSYTTGSA